MSTFLKTSFALSLLAFAITFGAQSALAATSVSLSASPTSIMTGDSSTLSWSSTEAASCVGTGFSTGGATSGSVVVSPAATSAYSITCTAPVTTTWQFLMEDTTDYWCNLGTENVLTDPNLNGLYKAYKNKPNCDLSSPEGTSCPTAGATCKVNTGQCVIHTEIYQCAAAGDTSSTSSATASVSIAVSPRPQCSDGLDNDADYLADILDPGCHTDGNALNPLSYNPNDNDEYTPPAPTCTLTSDKSSLILGQPVTLSWTSTNATSGVWSSNDNAGTSGSATFTNVTATTLFAITFSGPGGSITCSKTITIIPPPTAAIGLSPATIPQGSSSSLSWGSTNATSCVGTGFGTAGATSGSIVVSPLISTPYSVTCTGAGGSATVSTTLTVTHQCSDNVDNDADGKKDSADPGCHTDGNASNAGSYDPNDNSEYNAPAATCTLKVASCSLRGYNVTLIWTTTNASSTSINQGVGAVTPVAAGSKNVYITATKTFTMTAVGPGGSGQCSVTAIKK